MENLLGQAPALKAKLHKKVETRTIHWSDVRENPELIEGKVTHIETWRDDTGYQWTRSDVMLFIKEMEVYDRPNLLDFDESPVNVLEMVH